MRRRRAWGKSYNLQQTLGKKYISATVPPALHGVLFEIRLFLAGTSSGTSADVRESDRGERDSSLSGGRPPEMPENVAL